MRDRARALLLVGALVSCRKHIAVDSVPNIPYPSCPSGALPVGDAVAHEHLRMGQTSLESQVVEHYTLTHRDCLFVLDARQEWTRAIADVQIVYDAGLRPLRIWKRMTIPGDRRPDGHADIRRYELRTPEVTITHRDADGRVQFEILRGAHPTAVIAPGRGMLVPWLHRVHLQPGQTVRETVIDVRDPVERIGTVSLHREPDMVVPWFPRAVRVYTFFGRETVFADEHDDVIGDLAGMRPNALVTTPEPPPMPMYGTPDPVRTP